MTRVANPVQELDFGDLTLVSDDDTPYSLHAMEDGTNWGNPTPVMTIIESLLGDGALVTYDRDDNREVPIGIKVKADNGLQLALAEAALVAETRKRNTLTWVPPDGFGPPTVFDVITSSLEHVFSGQDELNLERHYVLHLVCYPSTRSAGVTATPATPAGAVPTTTSIDDCSATTGWTGSSFPAGATLADAGAELSLSDSWDPEMGEVLYAFTRVGSAIDFSTTPYLWLDWRSGGADGSYALPPAAAADGVELTRLATLPSPTAGYSRTFFLITDASVTVLEFTFRTFSVGSNEGGLGDGGDRTVWITQVSRSNVPPSTGTTRQQLRQLDVNGSARTIGALQIAHESDALGSTLVYTYPDNETDYQPALRPWMTASMSTTPDATLVSGARSLLDDANETRYEIPARLLPEGTYALMGRFRLLSDTDAIIQVTWGTTLGAHTIAVADTLLLEYDPGTLSDWTILQLATITLPQVALPPILTTAFVEIVLGTGFDIDIEVDELWLFNLTTGALTWVECGDGTPEAGGDSSFLWLDNPSIDRPRPAVWVGSEASRTDAHSPGADMHSWMTHTFDPGIVKVFTVTANAEGAEVSLRHFERWHTHAAS